MRLFVCSDIHMAVENLDRLLEKAGQPIDAVLFAGDLTNWGSRADAIKVLSHFQLGGGNLLQGFPPPTRGEARCLPPPIYTIPGNLDTPAVMEVLEDQTELVHGRVVKLDDWRVIGFGGGSLNNPGEILFSEDAISNSLESLLKKTDRKKTILLTHQPPANTKLDLVRGEPVGSRAVRTLIEKYQPAFQFCGHIHESWGEATIGVTSCYNVAAVKEGRAAVVDLETLALQRLAIA